MANRSCQIHRSGPSFEHSHKQKSSSPKHISPVAMKETEQAAYRSDNHSPSHSFTGSSFSSSSSSYIEISRSRSVERSGISTIFKAPLEHKYRAKKKKKKTRKTFFPFGSNSSSSSVNSDLAYGTGFIKIPKGQLRNQESKEDPKGSKNKKKHNKKKHCPRLTQKEPTTLVGSSSERSLYSESEGRHTIVKSRQKRRVNSHSSKMISDDAAITAEIMAVGVGLAKLDKESNKVNLISAQRKSTRQKGFASSNTYKLTRSKTIHDSNDGAEWESAYDTESDSSVDSKLAYGGESQKSWSLFGGKKKEKKTSPRNLRSYEKEHCTTMRDVRDNVFDRDLGQNSFKNHTEYSKKHPENENPGLSYRFDPISTKPKKVDKTREPVTSRLNPLISSNTHESTRFDSRGLDTLIPERSKAPPSHIIQPQPITPVSQNIYEPEKHLKSNFLSSASEQISFKNQSLYNHKNSGCLNDNMAETITASALHGNDRPKNESSYSTDEECIIERNNTHFKPDIHRRETEIAQLQGKRSEIQQDVRQEENNRQKIDHEIKIENEMPKRERNNDKRRKRELDFYESPQDWHSTSRINRKRIRSEIKLKEHSFQDERENLTSSYDRLDKVLFTEIDHSKDNSHYKSSKIGLSSSSPSVKDVTYNSLGDHDEHNISKRPEISFDSKNQQTKCNEAHYGSDFVRKFDKLSISHKSTPVSPGKHLYYSNRSHENSPVDEESNNKKIRGISKKLSDPTRSPIPSTGSTLTGSVVEDHRGLLSKKWSNENRRDFIESGRDYNPNKTRQEPISDNGNFRKKINGNFQNIVGDQRTTHNIHPQTRSAAQELNDYMNDSGSPKYFPLEKENNEQRNKPSSSQNEPNSKLKFESESNYPSDFTNHKIPSERLDQMDYKNLKNLNPEIDLHRNSLDFNSGQPFKPEPEAEVWRDSFGTRLMSEDQSQWESRPSYNSKAFPKITSSTLPANPYISKNVSWGENETKHFYDDIPYDRHQEYMSIPEKQNDSMPGKSLERAKYDTVEPFFLKETGNSRHGNFDNNIFRSGFSENYKNPSYNSPRSRIKDRQMPQAPRSMSFSRDQKDKFSTTTEMTSKTSHLKDFNEEDMGFIATVATGLQKTGFDPEIVNNVFGSRFNTNLPNLIESQNSNHVIHSEYFPGNQSLLSEDLEFQKLLSDLPSCNDEPTTLPLQKEFKKSMENREVTSKYATTKGPATAQMEEVSYQFPEKSSDMNEKTKMNVNNKIFNKIKDDEIPYETFGKDFKDTKKIRHEMIGEKKKLPCLFEDIFPLNPSLMIQSPEKFMKMEDKKTHVPANRKVFSEINSASEKARISHMSREKAERKEKKNENLENLREEPETKLSFKDQANFDNCFKSEIPFSREKFLPSSYFFGSKGFNPHEPAISSKFSTGKSKNNARYPSANYLRSEVHAIQNQHLIVVEEDATFKKQNTLNTNSKNSMLGKSNSKMIRTPQNSKDSHAKFKDSVNSSQIVPESLDEYSTKDKEKEIFESFSPANIQMKTFKSGSFPFTNMPFGSSKRNTHFLLGQKETLIPKNNTSPENKNKVVEKIKFVHYPHNGRDFEEENNNSNSFEQRVKSFKVEGLAVQAMLKNPLINSTISPSKDEKLPLSFIFGRQITEEPHEKGIKESPIVLAQTENLSPSNDFVSPQPHPDSSKNMKDEYRHKTMNLVNENENLLGAFPEESFIKYQDLQKPAHLIAEIEVTGQVPDENFKQAIIELSENKTLFSLQDDKGLNAPLIRSGKNEKIVHDKTGNSMLDSVASPDDFTKEEMTIKKSMDQPAPLSLAVESNDEHHNEKAQVSPTQTKHKNLMSEIQNFQAPQRPKSKFDPKNLEYDNKTKNIELEEGVFSEKLYKEHVTVANNSKKPMDLVTEKKNKDEIFIQDFDQCLPKPSNIEVITSENSRASQMSNIVSRPVSHEVDAYDEMPNYKNKDLADVPGIAKDIFTLPKYSGNKIKTDEWTRFKIPNIQLNRGTTPRSISNQDKNGISLPEYKAREIECTNESSNLYPVLKLSGENENFDGTSLHKSTYEFAKNNTSDSKKINLPEHGQDDSSHETQEILKKVTNLPPPQKSTSKDHIVGESIEKEKLKLTQALKFQFDLIEEPFFKNLGNLEIEDSYTETIPNKKISKNIVSNSQNSYPKEIKNIPRTFAALENTNESKANHLEEPTNKSGNILKKSTPEAVKDQSLYKENSIPKNKIKNFNQKLNILKKQSSLKTIPTSKNIAAHCEESTSAMNINIDNFNEIHDKVLFKTTDGNVLSATRTPDFQENLKLKHEKMNRNVSTENHHPNANQENDMESVRLTNNELVQNVMSNNLINTTCKIGKGNHSDHDFDHTNKISNHNTDVLKMFSQNKYPFIEEISLNATPRSSACNLQSEKLDATQESTSDINKTKLNSQIKNQMKRENNSAGNIFQEFSNATQPDHKKVISNDIIPFTCDVTVDCTKSDTNSENINYLLRKNHVELVNDGYNLRTNAKEDIFEKNFHEKRLGIEKEEHGENIHLTTKKTVQCKEPNMLQDITSDIKEMNLSELKANNIKLETELTQNVPGLSFEKNHHKTEREVSTKIKHYTIYEDAQKTKSSPSFHQADFFQRSNLEDHEINEVNMLDSFAENALEETAEGKQPENEKIVSMELISPAKDEAEQDAESKTCFESIDDNEMENLGDVDDEMNVEIESKVDVPETRFDKRNFENNEISGDVVTMGHEEVSQNALTCDDFNTTEQVDKESVRENNTDGIDVQEISESIKPDIEENVFIQIIPSTVEENEQRIESDPAPDTLDCFERCDVGEIDKNGVTMPISFTENTLEETAEGKQPENKKKVSMELISPAKDEAEQDAESKTCFESIDDNKMENLGDVENEINVEIESKFDVPETRFDNRNFENNEISGDVVSMGHEEVSQNALTCDDFNTTEQVDKESVRENNTDGIDVQEMVTENLMEQISESTKPDIEEDVLIEKILSTMKENVQHIKSDPTPDTLECFERCDVGETDLNGATMSNSFMENVLEENDDSKQPGNEQKVSMEVISSPKYKAEKNTGLNACFESTFDVEIDSLGDVENEINVEIESKFDVPETRFDNRNFENNEISGDVVSMGHEEVSQNALTCDDFNTTEQVDKESVRENNTDGIDVQEISESIKPDIEENVFIQIIPSTVEENEQRIESDPAPDTLDCFERCDVGEIDKNGVTMPISFTENTLEETAEGKQPENEKIVSMELISPAKDEAEQDAESKTCFESIDDNKMENLGDVDNEINVEIESKVDVPETRSDNRNFENNEISGDVVSMGHEEVSQNALTCDDFNTTEQVDKESVRENNTDGIDVQEMVTENLMEQISESTKPDIEEDVLIEKILSTMKENVQHIKSDPTPDTLECFERCDVGETDLNGATMSNSFMENVLEENDDSKQPGNEQKVSMEVISSPKYKAEKNTGLNACFESTFDVEIDSLGDVENEINVEIESKFDVPETRFDNRNFENNEISGDVVSMGHEEVSQNALTCDEFNTTEQVDKESVRENNTDGIDVQEMVTENLMEQISESTKPDIEEDVLIEKILSTTKENEQHIKSDPVPDTLDCFERCDVGEIDKNGVTMPISFTENTLEETAEGKQPENEKKVSMELISPAKDEAEQDAESKTCFESIDDNEMENLGDVDDEMNVEIESKVDVPETRFDKRNFENNEISGDVVTMGHEEVSQNALTCDDFNTTEQVDKESVRENNTDGIDVQEISESIKPDIEENVFIQIIPSTVEENEQRIESDPAPDTLDCFERCDVGEIDKNGVTMPISFTENTLEETAEGKQPENKKKVSMELISPAKDEAEQDAESKTCFESIDDNKMENLGDVDNEINVEIESKVDVPETRSDNRNFENNEISGDVVSMGHEEVSQNALTCDDFNTTEQVDKESVRENNTDGIDVQEMVTENLMEQISESTKPDIEEDVLIEKILSTMKENVQHIKSDPTPDTLECFERCDVGETDLNGATMSNSFMENVLEENDDSKQPGNEQKVSMEVISSPKYKAEKNTGLNACFESTFDVEIDSLGDVENEINVEIESKFDVPETRFDNRNFENNEISGDVVSMGHEEVSQNALTCDDFNTTEQVDKESVRENNTDGIDVQEMVTENLMEQISESTKPDIEEDVLIEKILSTMKENVQHIKSDPTPDTLECFERCDVGETDLNGATMSNSFMENVLEENDDSKQPGNEQKVSMEVISSPKYKAEKNTGLNACFESTFDVEIDSLGDVENEINVEIESKFDVPETRFDNRNFENNEISGDVVSMGHEEVSQNALTCDEFNTTDHVDKESVRENNTDGIDVQEMVTENLMEQISESTKPDIEEDVLIEKILSTTKENEQHIKSDPVPDTLDCFERCDVGEIDKNGVTMPISFTENTLEETAEGKQPENKKIVSMELISPAKDEAEQDAESKTCFESIDDNEMENLGDVDDEMNVEIESKVDVPETRFDNRNFENNKISGDVVSMGHEEVSQNALTCDDFYTTEQVDKESVRENNTDGIDVQEMVTENLMEQISESTKPDIEEDVLIEKILSTMKENVQHIKSDPTPDTLECFERCDVGETDLNGATMSNSFMENVLEENDDSKQPGNEQKVSMEVISSPKYKAEKNTGLNACFESTFDVEIDSLGDVENEINVEIESKFDVPETRFDNRNFENNEISGDVVSMGHEEVSQNALTCDEFNTTEQVDKESVRENNTDGIDVQEMVTENLMEQISESTKPDIEEDVLIEKILSTTKENEQHIKSDPVPDTLDCFERCDVGEIDKNGVTMPISFTENTLEETAEGKQPENEKKVSMEMISSVEDKYVQYTKSNPIQITTDSTNEQFGDPNAKDSDDVNDEINYRIGMSDKYTESIHFQNENEELYEINPFANDIISKSAKTSSCSDNIVGIIENNCTDLAIHNGKLEMDHSNNEYEMLHLSQLHDEEKITIDKEVLNVSESGIKANEDNKSMDNEDKLVQQSFLHVKDTSVSQNSGLIDVAAQSEKQEISSFVAGENSGENFEELTTHGFGVETSSVSKLYEAHQNFDLKKEVMRGYEMIANDQDAVLIFDPELKEKRKSECFDIEFSESNNDVYTGKKIPAKLEDVCHVSSNIFIGNVGRMNGEIFGEPVIRIDSAESGYMKDELGAFQCSDFKIQNNSDKQKAEIDGTEAPQDSLLKSGNTNEEDFFCCELTENAKNVFIEQPVVTNNDAIQSGTSIFATKTSCDLPDKILGISFGLASNEGIDSSEVLEAPKYSNKLTELRYEKEKADETIVREIGHILKPYLEDDIHPICSEFRLLSPDLHATAHTSDKICTNHHDEKPLGTEYSPTPPSKMDIPLPTARSNSKKTKNSDKSVNRYVEDESESGPILNSFSRTNELFDSTKLLSIEVESPDYTLNENNKETFADNSVSHTLFNKESISDLTKPCSSDLGAISPTHLVSGIEILPNPDEKLTSVSNTHLPLTEESIVSKELRSSELAVSKTKKKKKKKKVGQAGSPDCNDESFSKPCTETISNLKEISESLKHKIGGTEDLEGSLRESKDTIVIENNEPQNPSKHDFSVSTLEQPLASELEAHDLFEHLVAGKETTGQISVKDVDLAMIMPGVSQSSDLKCEEKSKFEESENRQTEPEKEVSTKPLALTKKFSIPFTSSEIGRETIRKSFKNIEINFKMKALDLPKYSNLILNRENIKGGSEDIMRVCEKGTPFAKFEKEADIKNNNIKSFIYVIDGKDTKDKFFKKVMRERITEKFAAIQNIILNVSEPQTLTNYSSQSNNQELSIKFGNSESKDVVIVEKNLLGSMKLPKNSEKSEYFTIEKVIQDIYVVEFLQRLCLHKINHNELLGFRSLEIPNSALPESVINYIYFLGCLAFYGNIYSESLNDYLLNLARMTDGGDRPQLLQQIDSSKYLVTSRALKNLFSGNFKTLSTNCYNKYSNKSNMDKCSRSNFEISLGNYTEPMMKFFTFKFLKRSENKKPDPKNFSGARQRVAYMSTSSDFCNIPFIQSTTEDSGWHKSFPLSNENNKKCNYEICKNLTEILAEDSSDLAPFEVSLEPYPNRPANEINSLESLYFAQDSTQLFCDESHGARVNEDLALEEIHPNEELSTNSNDVKNFYQIFRDKSVNAKLLLSSFIYSETGFSSSQNSNFHEKIGQVGCQNSFDYHQFTDTSQVLGREINRNENFNQFQSTPPKFDSVVRKLLNQDFAKVLKTFFRQDPMNYGEFFEIKSSPVGEPEQKFDSFALQKKFFIDKYEDGSSFFSSYYIKHEKVNKNISALSLEQPIKPSNLGIMSDSLSYTTSDLNSSSKTVNFHKKTEKSVTELSPIFQSINKELAEKDNNFFKTTNHSVEPGVLKLKIKEKYKNISFYNSELFFSQIIFSKRFDYQNNFDKSENFLMCQESPKREDRETVINMYLMDQAKISRESFWLKYKPSKEHISTYMDFKDNAITKKMIEKSDFKLSLCVPSVESHNVLELDKPKRMTSDTRKMGYSRVYSIFHDESNDSCIKLFERSFHSVKSHKRPIRNFLCSGERDEVNSKPQRSVSVTLSAKILQNDIPSSNAGTPDIGTGISLRSIMISARLIKLSRAIDLRHLNLLLLGVNIDIHKSLTIKWPSEDLKISSTINCTANLDISKDRFRSLIDPQFGKFPPLPSFRAALRETQSLQSSQNFSCNKQALLEDLNSGDKSQGDTQKNAYDSSANYSSQVSIPLNLYFKKKKSSKPSSLNLFKPSLEILFQPASQFSYKFLRSRSRQTSWNKATGFQPLYLLEASLQGSSMKSKIEDLHTSSMSPNPSQDLSLVVSNLENNKEDEKLSDFFLDCLQDRTELMTGGREEVLFSNEKAFQSVKTAKSSSTREHLANKIEQTSDNLLKDASNYIIRDAVINSKLSTKKEVEITPLDEEPEKRSLNNQAKKAFYERRILPFAIKNDAIYEQLLTKSQVENTPNFFPGENIVEFLPESNKPADKTKIKLLDHSQTAEKKPSSVEVSQANLANEQNSGLEKLASTVASPIRVLNEDYSAMNVHENIDLAFSRERFMTPPTTETKERHQIEDITGSKYSESKSPLAQQKIQVNIKNGNSLTKSAEPHVDALTKQLKSTSTGDFDRSETSQSPPDVSAKLPINSITKKGIKSSHDLSKHSISSFKNIPSSHVRISKLPTLDEERQLESTENSKEIFAQTNNKEKKPYKSREEIVCQNHHGANQHSSEFIDAKNQYDSQLLTSLKNEIIMPADKISNVVKEMIPQHHRSLQLVEQEKSLEPRRISSYSGNIKNKGLVQHRIQKFKSFDESQNLSSQEMKPTKDSWPQNSNINTNARLRLLRPKAEKSEEDSGSCTVISDASQEVNSVTTKSETQKRPLNKESSVSIKKKSKIESSIPDSASSSQSLRRNEKKTSGDLRSISQQEGKSDQMLNDLTLAATTPQPNEGRARVKTMADVYDGLGEGYITSPRSPTRPHSLRRRQSMKLLDLESQVENLIEQNRTLADEKEKIEQKVKSSLQTSLTNKDAEIERLNRTLAWLREEVSRFKKLNQSLDRENSTIAQQHMDRNAVLETQRTKLTQELDQIRDAHQRLTLTYQKEIESIVQTKDRVIAELRNEVDNASQRIKDAHKQTLLYKANDAGFLNLRDVRYFSDACHRLCQHVQQWVLRFSKYSDMKSCRLTREIKNDKIVERLDNSILDGLNVDNYLSDRIRRRDVFMSMVMTMIWEYIFTRYLFGMDRDQRQKLKSLEKTLSEVGPAVAVHSWRSITLTLLSKRLNFIQQKEQDTQAVIHAIIESLSEILPLPCNYEAQIQEQLSRVIKEAVDLSIEMRCQKAEYVMFPPLQPEYNVNGEIVSKVMFNPALMNERSNDNTSNEDLDPTKVHIRIVLFPLVIKKGDSMSRGNEDIVVYPAQVLAAKPKRLPHLENENRSKISIKSNSPAARSDRDLI